MILEQKWHISFLWAKFFVDVETGLETGGGTLHSKWNKHSAVVWKIGVYSLKLLVQLIILRKIKYGVLNCGIYKVVYMYGRKQEKIKCRQVLWRQTPIVLQIVSPRVYYIWRGTQSIPTNFLYVIIISHLNWQAGVLKKVWQFWKMRSWSRTASKLQNEIKSLMSRKTMPEVFLVCFDFPTFSFQTVFGNNNISTLRYSFLLLLFFCIH